MAARSDEAMCVGCMAWRYSKRRRLFTLGCGKFLSSKTKRDKFRGELFVIHEPTKQNGVIYKIPCECGNVYIGETGRSMRERIKEHDRDIYGLLVLRLLRFRSMPTRRRIFLSSIWSEVKFIDFDPHWYTQRVKEAIHIAFIPVTSTGTVGSKFPKHGSLRTGSPKPGQSAGSTARGACHEAPATRRKAPSN